MTSVTDAGDRVYSLTYDIDGRVTQIIDTALARSYTISYDLTGRLTAITDPLTNTETFAYDTENLITVVTDRRGNAVSIVYTTPAWDPDTRLPQSVAKGATTVSFGFNDATDTTTFTTAMVAAGSTPTAPPGSSLP